MQDFGTLLNVTIPGAFASIGEEFPENRQANVMLRDCLATVRTAVRANT